MEKTRFRDLSGWLKTAIIISWIVGGIYALSIILEFIIEYLYY